PLRGSACMEALPVLAPIADLGRAAFPDFAWRARRRSWMAGDAFTGRGGSPMLELTIVETDLSLPSLTDRADPSVAEGAGQHAPSLWTVLSVETWLRPRIVP
ncbi:MAG TPA: hypothetical protein VIN09_01735, partial [Chloroflexota bacterium]